MTEGECIFVCELIFAPETVGGCLHIDLGTVQVKLKTMLAVAHFNELMSNMLTRCSLFIKSLKPLRTFAFKMFQLFVQLFKFNSIRIQFTNERIPFGFNLGNS